MTGAPGRVPWDVRARLQVPLDDLAIKLGLWEGRDESVPQSHVRRAAGEAVADMDVMLRELYLMRGRAVSEIRVYDAASAARQDRLLAEAETRDDLPPR